MPRRLPKSGLDLMAYKYSTPHLPFEGDHHLDNFYPCSVRYNGYNVLTPILILHSFFNRLRYLICRCTGRIISNVGVTCCGFWIAVAKEFAD